MDNLKKEWSEEPDQKKQLHSLARLMDEQQDFEKKYMQVSSKLSHLKNSMKNLNHDVRSPIGAISGMIDLLLSKDKDQIEAHTRDLKMIKESAKSLLNLINGTLEVHDIHESMNIDRILSSAIMEINRLYLPMAQNKGIPLSLCTQIDSEIELPPNFFINLIQITGNLVANAIKFTPSNGSVDVVFALDAAEDPSMLNMTVTDTGKGMSPDQVSAFNQGKPVARSMGTNGEQSHGIGLQHVLEMVSEDDGSIFVNSENGSGTTFSLSFPLSDKNLTRKIAFHSIIKNGSVSVNGSHS